MSNPNTEFLSNIAYIEEVAIGIIAVATLVLWGATVLIDHVVIRSSDGKLKCISEIMAVSQCICRDVKHLQHEEEVYLLQEL